MEIYHSKGTEPPHYQKSITDSLLLQQKQLSYTWENNTIITGLNMFQQNILTITILTQFLALTELIVIYINDIHNKECKSNVLNVELEISLKRLWFLEYIMYR